MTEKTYRVEQRAEGATEWRPIVEGLSRESADQLMTSDDDLRLISEQTESIIAYN